MRWCSLSSEAGSAPDYPAADPWARWAPTIDSGTSRQAGVRPRSRPYVGDLGLQRRPSRGRAGLLRLHPQVLAGAWPARRRFRGGAPDYAGIRPPSAWGRGGGGAGKPEFRIDCGTGHACRASWRSSASNAPGLTSSLAIGETVAEAAGLLGYLGVIFSHRPWSLSVRGRRARRPARPPPVADSAQCQGRAAAIPRPRRRSPLSSSAHKMARMAGRPTNRLALPGREEVRRHRTAIARG